jgi:transcription antitermination factor NusG
MNVMQVNLINTDRILSAEESLRLPAEYAETRWYAAYTMARHEKRVALQLEERSVEHFLPLYGSIRRWKDRRVTLYLPLFPGYVFVRVALRDRLAVLQVPGVARLVGFNGRPCALPDSDIDAMQGCLARKIQLKPHPYLQIGRRVRVGKGPLQGLQGILVRKKNGTRFVISLDLIMRSVMIEVDGSEVDSLLSETLTAP